MRRPVTSTAAAALAAVLLLAGCSGDGEPETDTTATTAPTAAATDGATEGTDTATASSADDVAALETITVEGEPGSAPTLDFEQPLNVSGTAAAVASAGDGATLEEGQLLLVDYVQVNGADGQVLDSTYETQHAPLVLSTDFVAPQLVDVLIGQNVGARVLFANPTQEAAAIMALEVVDAVSSQAEGTAVDAPEGMPAVTRADSGEPSIEPVDGEAPTELVAVPVIEGEGKAIEEGDEIWAHYSGWLWDGTPFDSSWQRGTPFNLIAGAGQVIEGWDTGLIGQTVGSQVLFVIPPELGYGEAGSPPTIPGGATLVFVVDILRAG